MKECQYLVDSQLVNIEPQTADQIRIMSDLMGEETAFHLDTTPAGTQFSVSGFIGQINFRDGGIICVAPDIHANGSDLKPQKLLIEMLYSIFNINADRALCDDLFEVFVRLFIDSVQRLMVKGLRSKYHSVEGNEKVFKGRIMFSQHIRENYIHKERIYVEYEIYSQNRPENRLIKKTLESVLRKTHDPHNIKGAKTLLLELEEIESSADIGRDFSMCIMDRNMMDYVSPMLWCDVFLNGMGLGNSAKGELSYALLVDANEIMAAYVGRMSTLWRNDGSYSLRYTSNIVNDGNIGGTSVIRIGLKWAFFDKNKNARTDDAEALYLSAPGYRVVPSLSKGERLKAMAASHLSDMLKK